MADGLPEPGAGSSATDTRPPAVSARTRCGQAIWEITLVVGALTSGAAVLVSLLIEDSLQCHVVSALFFAAIPAAAALAIGAMLVSLLRLLGIAYDLVRTPLLPGFIYCVRLGTALLTGFARRHKEDMGRALAWGAGRLMQFTKAFATRIGQILGRAGARARSRLAWVRREIALEALWIKRSARRLRGMTPFVAGWPIRSLARLTLRLIERKRRASGLRFRVSAGSSLTRRTGAPA